MTEASYLAGRLLLAMPGMGDPRFDHAVIAMCVHDREGALGIGVGAVHPEFRLHELLEDLGIDPGVAPDCAVLVGGPVEPQRGFVLHSGDWHGPGMIEVEGLCCLSGSQEVLRAIAAGTGPRQWLVALGYAGWGAGQLDGEMRRHGWYAAGAHPQVLFDTPASSRWRAAWQAEGIDPALLSSETGRA
ncbi:YqgE/AlgH family protein [Novosphingobium sp.]|uniref:YqgE/AlgH family protein n=1 Tax=Novosphingobium sp. TaxID=1874826 RepID=UPI0035AF1ECC